MGKTLRAVPGAPRPSNSRRNSLIGKIMVARKEMRLIEDDYRQLLLDTTGKISLKQCSDAQLVRMVEVMKGKGFRPRPRSGARLAEHPMARKARAMWISLYHLGVVHNREEKALEAFAKRQLGCEKLAWARQSDAFRLIEALKDMAIRNGWVQVDHRGRPLGPLGLQDSLCNAIVQKLKDIDEIPDDWALHIAAYRLCGIVTTLDRPFNVEDHQQLAAALGAKLREAMGEAND